MIGVPGPFEMGEPGVEESLDESSDVRSEESSGVDTIDGVNEESGDSSRGSLAEGFSGGEVRELSESREG